MQTLDAFDGVEVGRQLGHDLFRFSRLPACPAWPDPVLEGFAEAAARGGSRRQGDRFERKHLQLRLGAWQRRRVMADDVTPDLLRLAVLMEGPCFATRQHLAPLLPLVAPLPRCSVRLAIQQIQRLFTLGAGRPAGKNALVKALAPAAVHADERLRLRTLADAVHDGLKCVDPAGPCWDVWLQARAMDALVRWRESLNDRSWALVARIAGQLAGARCVTSASLGPWHLNTRGDGAAMQRVCTTWLQPRPHS